MTRNSDQRTWTTYLGRIWFAALMSAALVVLFWDGSPWSSESEPAAAGAPVTLANAKTAAADSLPPDFEHRDIETVRVGDRMLARNPEISDEERAAWLEPDWSDWRLVKLEMTKPDGGVLHIEMIRPHGWFELNEVQPGATIHLDLPEMGARGQAKVISTGDCPAIQPPPGQVVTATFAHPPSTAVLDVRFENESQSIGVTDNHFFWSVDRRQFVPIGQMSEGEQVQTYSGDTKRIEQKPPRPGPQAVFNLEVYGEHVYFVGEYGLLAHNTCADAVFGIRDHIDDFTGRLGPSAERFPFYSLTDEADDLASGLRHAMERSRRNQFNFEGFNVQKYDDWLRRGGPNSYPHTDVTNWELHELFNNHLDKTSFHGAPGSDFIPWPF